MNHNPFILERLADQKLAELRAEGLRSQQAARVAQQRGGTRNAVSPQVWKIFTEAAARAIRSVYVWMRQPCIRNPLAR